MIAEDVVYIVGDALDLEVRGLTVAQEVVFSPFAAPLVLHFRFPRIIITRDRHRVLLLRRRRSVLLTLRRKLFAIDFGPAFVVQVFDGIVLVYIFLRNLIEVGEFMLELLDLGILRFVARVGAIDLLSDEL